MAKDIRVRYAPSPTGLLHIGNARTALFNYLYARHHGGTFIIRIEDTDRKRHVEDGERSQLDNLRWLGIDWDESPETHENYRQSERLPLYQKYIDQLLAEGKAYKSYVTEEELAAERERQEAAGETPRYINEFLGMTEEEKAAYIAEREAAGIVPTVRLAVNESGIYKWHDIVKGDIEFDDVSFRYPDGEEEVLSHFSLKIPAGTNVAIVGETGAGKSTLVNLACRFFEPTGGRILIDGKDYRERSQLWLHSRLGYVLQNPHLFSGTVMDNIRYGRLDATDEEVKQAAKAVSADTVVEHLENGYDSDVGEGGDKLSTGEKQLISFARAVLADPAIFVLDEDTSSIDTQAEQLIQNATMHLLEGRTSFLIAHRLSTIRQADLILVVKDGKIVEQGKHEDLLRKGGYYHDLYSKQFQEEEMSSKLNS